MHRTETSSNYFNNCIIACISKRISVLKEQSKAIPHYIVIIGILFPIVARIRGCL